MKIKDVIATLEAMAPPSLQEGYDNAGLIAGDENATCTGILVSLDATPAIVHEAIQKRCNLVVSHHPIIFAGLKKVTGKNYVQTAVINAIKNEIALYAIHTNLDNIISGVNGRIASLLGLQNISVLAPGENQLKKLYTFVPVSDADKVRRAIHDAGGGHIGNYDECSFNVEGFGTFRGGKGTNPHVGQRGELHREQEIKIEVVFPAWLEGRIIKALLSSHPYEEVAYDIIRLENRFSTVGSGAIGDLAMPVDAGVFLSVLKEKFKLQVIRHTELPGEPVRRVAVCGGAGSFLIPNALAANADMFITSDVKYHEFFDANGKMV
ncbi:MAG TPA: Nif3-like dinuclear metal center hexameric protein, partial [Chitinophagaceae bacterium]|nr:Nif3-like dinuclear metal center hexameric protein [Chitinophagaceae bacterium]